MIPKTNYVRSPSLMKAYRAIPCQHCGRDDGTVCGAHANSGIFGKGMGIKSSDVYAASLCSTCHSELDQGKAWTKEERLTMWWIAHRRTVRELVQRGLWPKRIEVPETEVPPWGVEEVTS